MLSRRELGNISIFYCLFDFFPNFIPTPSIWITFHASHGLQSSRPLHHMSIQTHIQFQNNGTTFSIIFSWHFSATKQGIWKENKNKTIILSKSTFFEAFFSLTSYLSWHKSDNHEPGITNCKNTQFKCQNISNKITTTSKSKHFSFSLSKIFIYLFNFLKKILTSKLFWRNLALFLGLWGSLQPFIAMKSSSFSLLDNEIKSFGHTSLALSSLAWPLWWWRWWLSNPNIFPFSSNPNEPLVV